MQQRKGATSAAAAASTGPMTTMIHQDSNAAASSGQPLASTFASLLQRLTRLNTAIKSAMSKREEEIGDHEGYRRY